MRELNVNGYIDDAVLWGDEITPDMLHDMLYGSENDLTDRADAEKGVQAWFDRKKPNLSKAPRNDAQKPSPAPAPAPVPVPNNRIKASDLEARLALLKY